MLDMLIREKSIIKMRGILSMVTDMGINMVMDIRSMKRRRKNRRRIMIARRMKLR